MASIALICEEKPIYSEECLRQKSHSEWINGAVERAIQTLPGGWDALDVVAVTHGPGSFTGVRVATNLAKTIGFAWQKPIVSFSSLEVLAHQADDSSQATHILPVINAFKNMMFYGVYVLDADKKVHCLVEPSVVEVAKLNESLATQPSLGSSLSFQVLGDGFAAYESHFTSTSEEMWLRSSRSKDHPTAMTLGQMVGQRWNDLQLKHWRELIPTYLRASAAEENRQS
jgi:tRNA threonylcarbamoyladenosine biosynthesis protein TsaB